MHPSDPNDTQIHEIFHHRWSTEQAKSWYQQQPWLCGCNYIPATAINQLEMFQADTFDLPRIDLELSWAQQLGFNCLRVFSHYLLWEADAPGYFKRWHKFLEICASHKLRVLFVFFDDCWNQDPQIGIQPAPQPGIHNSGWAASPGQTRVRDSSYFPKLKAYLTETLIAFKDDTRILGWDLYNEPGNSNILLTSFPLLVKTFEWAQQIRPSQPLTCGIWHWNRFKFKMGAVWRKFYEFQTNASDVITFHNYSPVKNLEQQIHALQRLKRPVICTEWMARPHSVFQTHLPVFKAHNVGCMNWGFVAGKTNTIFPWGSKPSITEPPLWFHEIFRFDGTPYKTEEIAAIKNATLGS